MSRYKVSTYFGLTVVIDTDTSESAKAALLGAVRDAISKWEVYGDSTMSTCATADECDFCFEPAVSSKPAPIGRHSVCETHQDPAVHPE